MDFRQTILSAIQQAVINHLKLNEVTAYFAGYPSTDHRTDAAWPERFLEALFDADLLKPAEVREAVAEGIVLYGLKMYDQVQAGVWPDHVASPPALAYAIKSCRIPPERAKNIRFDNDETLEQFLQRADRLVERVLSQLFPIVAGS